MNKSSPRVHKNESCRCSLLRLLFDFEGYALCQITTSRLYCNAWWGNERMSVCHSGAMRKFVFEFRNRRGISGCGCTRRSGTQQLATALPIRIQEAAISHQKWLIKRSKKRHKAYTRKLFKSKRITHFSFLYLSFLVRSTACTGTRRAIMYEKKQQQQKKHMAQLCIRHRRDSAVRAARKVLHTDTHIYSNASEKRLWI